jgi:tetratricopeptide (TPR) repeat protein
VAGAIVIVVAVGVGLLFPWATSAYYLERGGHNLNSPGATTSQLNAAQDQLQRALAWDANNAQAYYLLARLYRLREDWPQAAGSLAHYVRLRPKNPRGYWELSLACEQLKASELGQVAGAACGRDKDGRQAILVRLWSLAGQSASDFVTAAGRFLEAEKWDQAEAYYRRALIVELDAPAAWLGLADLFRARGDIDAAMEAWDSVIAHDVDSEAVAEAYARRGEIFAAERRWDDASAELSQAVALLPEEGRYHLAYGWYLYRAKGPIEEVRDQLTAAAALLPENPIPFLRLANISFSLSDYEQALTYASEAIEANPAQVWGWIWKARALGQLGRGTEAESALRQAIQLDPENAAVYAELGDLFDQAGRTGAAIAAYEQAISLAPNETAYRLSLAQVYAGGGQIAEAIAIYQQILELEPDNEAAGQALQALEQ